MISFPTIPTFLFNETKIHIQEWVPSSFQNIRRRLMFSLINHAMDLLSNNWSSPLRNPEYFLTPCVFWNTLPGYCLSDRDYYITLIFFKWMCCNYLFVRTIITLDLVHQLVERKRGISITILKLSVDIYHSCKIIGEWTKFSLL